MALTDALGNLVDFCLLPGQAHDLRGTAELIDGLSCRQLLADRAFDANWVREALAEAGIEAVIPPKYRGIAMRCCKTDTSYSAFIAIVATVIRLR
jgi:transposase